MISDKKYEEQRYVQGLLELLGYHNAEQRAADEGPDFIYWLSGRRIGIEVTKGHVDGGAAVKGGSTLRRQEVKKAKDSKGKLYGIWGRLNAVEGVYADIVNKIRVAEDYSHDQYDELWLLVVSQLSEALGSTWLVAKLFNLAELNRLSHDALKNSRFGSAYLYLPFERIVYTWSSSTSWKIGDTPVPKSVSEQGPSFKEVLQDPDWLRNPDEKARQEAERFLDELELARTADKGK